MLVVGLFGKGWIGQWLVSGPGDGEWWLFDDGPGWRQSPCKGSPGAAEDDVGLVVELLDLGVVAVNEVNDLLDCREALSFLLDEQADCSLFVAVCNVVDGWRQGGGHAIACG